MIRSIRNQRPDSGFSLLEVIVALAIFAIGAASLFGLYSVAVRGHQRALNLRTSALVAEEAFNQMRISLLTGRPPPQGEVKVPGLGRDVRYEIQAAPLDSQSTLFSVTVTVKWKMQGRDQQEVFKTVMVRVAL